MLHANAPPRGLFDGVPVPEVDEIKLLGTLIDKQLTFAPQLRAMALKARQRAGFTRRASRYLDAKCNAMVYKAFTRPCLETCAPLLDGRGADSLGESRRGAGCCHESYW